MNSLASACFVGLVALSPFAVGCAAEQAPTDDESPDPSTLADDTAVESDIVVKRCPSRLSLSIEDISIFDRTPSTAGGQRLSASERDNLTKRMAEARKLGSFEVDLGLGSTATGRCFYHAGANRYVEPSVTFYTKGGRDLLQIETGKFRVYATVTSYSTDGVQIRAGRTPVLISLPTPGPYAEDARTIVNIGFANLAP